MDELSREIERLGNMSIRLPVETDADGYIDRECPNEDCMFQFKVLLEDWINLCKDEAVFCPMCGSRSEPADKFLTTEHEKQAEEQAVDYFGAELNHALERGARAFNRRQPKNSFIRMVMKVEGKKWHKPLVPLKAQDVFRLKIECKECGAHFAVVGSAFFCPCCGHSAAVRVFNDAMAKIEAKVSNLERIREAVAEVSEDEAAVTCRSFLESGLTDGVVAFQRVCEELYKKHPNAKPNIPVNVFQRLQNGSELWKELIGKGYSDFLSSAELERLRVLFQRRHLLAHREGIVDQKYIDRSSDINYDAGQRIVVKEEDVLNMVSIIKKLVSAYLKELGYA